MFGLKQRPPGDMPGGQAGTVDTTALAIDATAVEKVYGATVALAGADLKTHPGEIHALLGENGAGKSTLVRILAGVEKADGGSVQLFGQPVAAGLTHHADRSCAFIHQDLALFESMSVAANIALGGGGFRRRLGMIDDRATVSAAQELLDGLGIAIEPSMLVGELPLADQTAVAIARALSHGVRLIVLDEPTAYLEARQVRAVLKLLANLREQGVACLLITHRAGDVLEVCDAITVLREGRTVASQSAAGLSEGRLIELISGHEATHRELSRGPSARRDTVLRLQAAAAPTFGPVSLDVGAGEIVGVCGLADAGAFEVGKAVFGMVPLQSGAISLSGAPMEIRSPSDAMAVGIGYVPAERRRAGIAENLSARENIFLRSEGAWFKPLQSRNERRLAYELMERLGVYPLLPEHALSTFSGGNQQKIVLAKWIRRQPKLLVLNEPTAGVDLAAKADIHQRLRVMCAELGCGVLMISSDFGEVADVADRAYVMRRKLVVDEVDQSDLTADRLVSLAYGGINV
jgi:ABC-type sugar transport system ATPase subunit